MSTSQTQTLPALAVQQEACPAKSATSSFLNPLLRKITDLAMRSDNASVTESETASTASGSLPTLAEKSMRVPGASGPSDASQAAPSANFLKGLQARSAELCTYFGLPEKETFLDDYNCALRKHVLLQGRLYIFDHYVCFSSFVFGFAKKIVIPLEHVTAVRKKTHLRFPNSIKIELCAEALANGLAEQYFFTSFLSREDAFQLICNCWAQSRAPDGQLVVSPGAVQGDETIILEEAQGSEGEGAAGLLSGGELPTSRSAGPKHLPGDDDDDGEEESTAECMWDVITPGPVPEALPRSHVVVKAVLDGTPKEVYDVLFADNSHFIEDFLESVGNRRIILGPWTRDAQLGHVRDIQFVTPIKGFSTWGVPNTHCHQSHRFRRFEGDHLVYESCQTMRDIPYGDCFTVDLRWDIQPLPDAPAASSGYSADGLSPRSVPQVQLTIAVRVPFTRSCMLRKVIESGTIKQVRENHAELVSQLSAVLAQVQRERQPVELVSPVSMMARMSNQLPTVTSLGGADPQAVGGLSRSGSANTLTRAHGLTRMGTAGHPSPLARTAAAGAEPHAVEPAAARSGIWSWRVLDVGLGSLRRGSIAGAFSFFGVRPASEARGVEGMGAAEEEEAVKSVYGVQEETSDAAPSVAWAKVLQWVLVVLQVVVLAALVVLWRGMQVQQQQQQGAVLTSTRTADVSDVSQVAHDAFNALSQDMWARRVALLSDELALLRNYTLAVEAQLREARVHIQ